MKRRHYIPWIKIIAVSMWWVRIFHFHTFLILCHKPIFIQPVRMIRFYYKWNDVSRLVLALCFNTVSFYLSLHVFWRNTPWYIWRYHHWRWLLTALKLTMRIQMPSEHKTHIIEPHPSVHRVWLERSVWYSLWR